MDHPYTSQFGNSENESEIFNSEVMKDDALPSQPTDVDDKQLAKAFINSHLNN